MAIYVYPIDTVTVILSQDHQAVEKCLSLEDLDLSWGHFMKIGESFPEDQ